MEAKPIIVEEKRVDLNKIFTPAPDAEVHLIKKDKTTFGNTFASSAFYMRGVHPTAKEQIDLARAISKSLSDSSNYTLQPRQPRAGNVHQQEETFGQMGALRTSNLTTQCTDNYT